MPGPSNLLQPQACLGDERTTRQITQSTVTVESLDSSGNELLAVPNLMASKPGGKIINYNAKTNPHTACQL